MLLATFMTILHYSVRVHTQSIGLKSILIRILIPIIPSWAFFLRARWHGRRKYDIDSMNLVTKKGLDPKRCLLSRWGKGKLTHTLLWVLSINGRGKIYLLRIESSIFLKCDCVLQITWISWIGWKCSMTFPMLKVFELWFPFQRSLLLLRPLLQFWLPGFLLLCLRYINFWMLRPLWMLRSHPFFGFNKRVWDGDQ